MEKVQSDAYFLSGNQPLGACVLFRAVARALVGGGGGDIHMFVLCPTDFF